METIKMSNNWNYKLFAKHFTTIRLWSKKWQVGQMYELDYNDHKSVVECVSTTPIYLKNIPEYVWFSDTGYNRDESIEMIKKIYKGKNVDLEKHPFCIVVFRQDIKY